jgi:transposase
MTKTSIIGRDLAKRVVQAHGARADGGVAFRKKLSREKVLAFLALKPRGVGAMEACGSAHHFGRAIRDLGHEVRLIAPSYVKPFVKRQKNDAADAEAIAEAARRPAMRFVAVKPREQQARAMLFRTRDLLVRRRTRLINAARAVIWPSMMLWRRKGRPMGRHSNRQSRTRQRPCRFSSESWPAFISSRSTICRGR